MAQGQLLNDGSYYWEAIQDGGFNGRSEARLPDSNTNHDIYKWYNPGKAT